MSKTLRKYDASGALLWSHEIEDFTGKSVVDLDGNVYALLDHGVSKYSPDGDHIKTEVSYSVMGLLYYSAGSAQDIAFGRVDENAPCLLDDPTTDRIYIVGGRYLTGSTPDSCYVVLDTDLNKLYSTHTYGDKLEGDYFVQVEVDNYGNAYMVGHNWKQIYKYSPLTYDYYDGWLPEWTNASFIKSSVIPVIAVAGNGNLYVSGEALFGEGSWMSAFGPSYYNHYDTYATWTGAEYQIIYQDYASVDLTPINDWINDLAPLKIRIQYSLNVEPEDSIGFELFIGSSANGFVEQEFSDITSSGTLEWTLPLALCHDSVYSSPAIDTINFTPIAGNIGSTLNNIEFYTQTIQKGIFGISSEGETIEYISSFSYEPYLFFPEIFLSGFLSRDTEIQQMLLSSDNKIVVKEDNSVISLIDPAVGTVWSDDTNLAIQEIIPNSSTGITLGEAEPLGQIFLSSTPVVTGTEAQNVSIENNNIVFQSDLLVEGYQLSVYPVTNEIVFSADVKIPSIVGLSEGNLIFNSAAAIVVPVITTPGIGQFDSTPTISGHHTIIKPLSKISFYSNLEASDITGDQVILTTQPGQLLFAGKDFDLDGFLTIIKPNTKLQFDSVPEISGNHIKIEATGNLNFSCDDPFVFQLGLPVASGIAILNDSTGFSFSSTRIDINKQTVYVTTDLYSGGSKITLSSPALVISSIDRVAIIKDASFPSFELSLQSGGSIDSELPKLDLKAPGFIGSSCELISEFPSFTIESAAGGYVDLSLINFDMSMIATINSLAAISSNLPIFDLSLLGSHASEGDINITMPRLKAAMEMTIGIVGSMVMDTPKVSMTLNGIFGTTAEIDGIFSILKLRALANPSGPGEISFTLPSIKMESDSDGIDSDILRYNLERIR